MITVRVLPRSFDAEYARAVGEGIFCDRWDVTDSLPGDTCSGRAEIELVVEYETGLSTTKRVPLHLCREHVGYIATQLLEAIELVDAGDIFGGASK